MFVFLINSNSFKINEVNDAFYSTFFVITFLASISCVAAASETTNQTIAVNKSSCSKLASKTQPFVLVLSSGDNLIESINQCAKDAKLNGAIVSGIGQLHNPVLAYFSSDPNAKPTLTHFKGYYELASLNGDITNNDGKYYTHLHAVLADKQFHGIAGHVNGGETGLTAEISIRPLSANLQRTVDAKTGFGPIELNVGA